MNCHLPEQEKVSGNIAMNLYDINKQVVSKLPGLDDETLETKKALFVEYDIAHEEKYYMLLCNELKYYTVFSFASNGGTAVFSDEVIGCIKDFSDEVKSIELNELDAIEIWFVKDEETYVMYFFPYTQGVIECA